MSPYAAAWAFGIHRLQPATHSPQEAIGLSDSYLSRTATYTRQATINKRDLRKDKRIVISLGELNDIAVAVIEATGRT